MKSPNPYFEQAKHVVGATALFLLVFAVAITLDRISHYLVSIGWIENEGIYYWVFKIAEVTIMLVDVTALLVIVMVTTYKLLRKLIE